MAEPGQAQLCSLMIFAASVPLTCPTAIELLQQIFSFVAHYQICRETELKALTARFFSSDWDDDFFGDGYLEEPPQAYFEAEDVIRQTKHAKLSQLLNISRSCKLFAALARPLIVCDLCSSMHLIGRLVSTRLVQVRQSHRHISGSCTGQPRCWRIRAFH
jgi:hypothetical protein